MTAPVSLSSTTQVQTHHVASAIYRSKRERTRAACDTSNLTIHLPVPQRLTREFVLASPLQRERHSLVSDLGQFVSPSSSIAIDEAHPITDPVTRTNVDERTHAALQQGSDVVLSREHQVHVDFKRETDFVIARAEVRCERWIDANCLPYILAIEEIGDVSWKALERKSLIRYGVLLGDRITQ